MTRMKQITNMILMMTPNAILPLENENDKEQKPTPVEEPPLVIECNDDDDYDYEEVSSHPVKKLKRKKAQDKK